jgi:hypothetical protein
MKMKKFLICLFLIVLPISMFIGPKEAKAKECVVTCSSGNSGQCFILDGNIQLSGDSYFSCLWTGKMADNCSLLDVAILNSL